MKNYFIRDDYLSLKKLVNKSFGVFDEKPIDVEINKKVADFTIFLFTVKILTKINSFNSGLIEMVW